MTISLYAVVRAASQYARRINEHDPTLTRGDYTAALELVERTLRLVESADSEQVDAVFLYEALHLIDNHIANRKPDAQTHQKFRHVVYRQKESGPSQEGRYAIGGAFRSGYAIPR